MDVPIKITEVPLQERLTLMRQAGQALAKNPKNVDALVTMGSLQLQNGNHAEALTHLKKALAIQKNHPEILTYLIKAEHQADRFNKAKSYARKLCEVEPRKASSHTIYGTMLLEVGQPQHAIAAYRKAAALEPDNAEHYYHISDAQRMAGDHEASIASLEKVLSIDGTHAMALYQYSTVKKFSVEEAEALLPRFDAAAARLEGIKPEDLNEEDEALLSSLYYGAGKVCDDAGFYDRAFSYYERANGLKDSSRFPIMIAAIGDARETFTRPFIESRAEAGLPTRQPIFILGMPRSGTTLTESLCGAHSKVTAGDELVFISNFARRLGIEGRIMGAFRKNMEGLSRAQITGMAREYLEKTKPAHGKTPHFTDKLPHNFVHIGLISVLFPEARIIHVRRHPIDNCLSLYANSMTKFHNTYKSKLSNLGIYYRHYADLMRYWREEAGIRFHDVYYEDLVANTEFVARGMIDYLGLDWEDNVMDREHAQRSVKTLSLWQVRQPVYQSSKGKWRHYEEHLGPLIDSLGDIVGEYERELQALEQDNGAAA